MSDQDTVVPDADRTSRLDGVALDLQELRARAGNPSYAEIVLRITRQREARGVPALEARPGRTTVYDAFRVGRRRIDPHLVVEIVRALGATDAEAEVWAARCREVVAPRAVVSRAVEPSVSVEEPPAVVATSVRFLVLVCVGSLAMNLVGRELVNLLDLPLHLDMTGTATAAVVCGPWWGALVGVLTNGIGAALSGAASLPFAAVNVVGALLWGYGVRRFRMADSIPRFFVLNLVVALACSLVATPIIWLLFSGNVGFGQDAVTVAMGEYVPGLFLAVFLANLLISVLDKSISGFLALVALEARRGSTKGLPN